MISSIPCPERLSASVGFLDDLRESPREGSFYERGGGESNLYKRTDVERMRDEAEKMRHRFAEVGPRIIE
jgi:hypothetical protein